MATMSIANRLTRWKNLFENPTPGRVFLVHSDINEIPMPPYTQPYAELAEQRIDYAWAFYQNMQARAEWLDDDSIPHIAMWTGTEIFAEVFGCEVHRYEDGGNPTARPLITKPEEVASLKMPTLEHPVFESLFGIMDELHRRDPDALMMMVDIQSPLDIAALIWDKTYFYMGIMDEPNAVNDLCQMTYDILTAFVDEWFRRYGTTFIGHYPNYPFWDGITLSEDEIGAISVDMFDEFALPWLVKLADRYGNVGIHCCANAQHQWDGLLKVPNLKLLNLVQDDHTINEALEFFAPHLVQWHHGLLNGSESPAQAMAKFPKDNRLVIELMAGDDKDKAIRYAAEMAELCR
jgi:hypothetical protein